MREYLIEFFDSFEYDRADAEYLLSVYDRISDRDDTNAVWREALNIYNSSMNCDFDLIIALAQDVAQRLDIHRYTTELLVFICLSKRLRQIYIERGIDLAIFHESMLDLKYKLDECKVVKGIVGSFVAFWFNRFFNMERFALGRLQFEVDRFGQHYERDGHILTPESKAINIHIPRTLTHLTPESCDESFRMAKDFFAADFSSGECAFICHSWILYPGNKQILPESTNVYKFMSRFDIFNSADDPALEDLWRIFDTDEKNPDLLPGNTSMRRAYIHHLKGGGVIGWGHGVFFL